MKVSVIVPVYNVEAYIEDCINSLCHQTYTNIEVIVVDDGSPDDSIHIAKKCVENDSRFVFVSKANGGLSDARNYGLQVASGEYVTFVDSDDYVTTDYIEKMVTTLQATHADMVVGNVAILKDEPVTVTQNGATRVFNTQEAIDAIYSGETSLAFSTAWGKLAPLSWYKEITFPVGKLHEDEFTTYKLYIKSNTVAFIDHSLYVYRVRDNSIMQKQYTLKNTVVLDALLERVEEMKKHHLDETLTLIAIVRLIGLMKVKLNKKELKVIESTLNNVINQVMRQLSGMSLGIKHRMKVVLFRYFYRFIFK
ncbi:glycosyltransferase [Carnobacteriaceae bacterium zg-ZUI252]|nr:glycosyltransferase [Carnobacteriaceae bacterium zg-ZUI252]QTU83022.1 glycosyltransferase [Carnobacteriaceae bacterium zg-C25]